MGKIHALFLLLLALSIPISASAQTSCNQYRGQTPSIRSFDSVVEKFKEVGPIDEFENTAARRERREIAARSIGTPIVIEVNYGSSPKYNADLQAFQIQSRAFSSSESFDQLFIHGGIGVIGEGTLTNDETRALISLDISNPPAVTIARIERENYGTYLATNGLGAQRRVTRNLVEIQAVYEPNRSTGKYGEHRNFRGVNRYDDFIGTVPMEPEAARQLNNKFRHALVVAPLHPYFAGGRNSTGTTPTVSNPYDTKLLVSILLADIQCALVLDQSGKVLASIQTK
jgi:hypothetical protein